MASGEGEHTRETSSAGADATETLVAGDLPQLAAAVTAIAAETSEIHHPAPKKPPTARAPSYPGELIGEDQRFEILEEIGAGGMGLVYRAKDRQLDRLVAIKFFLPDHAVSAQELAAMLKQEARATARLAHENIVRIFDLGTWNQLPFLVMEYLDGEPLTAVLYRRRLEIPRAVDLLLDVAHGLDHAHGQGIIHRDLKPSNVLVLASGRAKILDFGIAQFFTVKAGELAARAAVEREGASSPRLVGTPAYMAPEQWRGDAQDGRTDVWAAGVMLFEMLTGQLPPWGHNIRGILSWLASGDVVPSVRSVRPDAPEGLDTIVARALKRDPAERYATARDLADALVAFKKAQSRATGTGQLRVTPRLPSGPERRQLTVLAAVLSGLESQELDLDEMGEILRDFHRLCAAVVQEHGGCVATSVGGKLIACFGYPAAQEDDAQRAVRAALRIIARAGEVGPAPASTGAAAEVRVGVHTGLVIVEGMAGEMQRGIPAIQGEAPDVASRLADRAAVGSVVVSHSTHVLVPGLFATEPLSRPSTARGGGIKTPAMYSVLGELDVQSRFDQIVSDERTPLCGRESEAGLLAALWDEARKGNGRFVMISGDAGIGKSRLVQVLRQRVDREGSVRMTCQCWPHFRSSAFHPVIQLLTRSLRIVPEDSAPQRIRKIEDACTQLALPLETTVPLFAALLSVDLAPPYAPPALTPERQKARTIEALAELFLRMSARRPVLFVVEDLHWMDHSTLELLNLLFKRAPEAPILVLLTFRPEFQPPWPDSAHLYSITLDRLSPDLASRMVEQAAGGKTLPPDMIAELVVRTDGIPLFVEELTRMVLDTMETQPGTSSGRAPSRAITLPPTLHELLLARLDRLSVPAKEVAQLGSVLGRDFSYRLIDAVAQLPEQRLHEGLAELAQAGVLFHQGKAPDAKYMFKHALLQEAAYQSLLKSKRQGYHLTIARTLTEKFAEIAETQPELVAHHYAEGGDAESAVTLWEKAGARATQRSANIEAISHYQRAMDLLSASRGSGGRDRPRTPASIKRELGLCIAMGSPIMAIKGYAAPEVEKIYGRARELCQLLGEDAQLFPAMAGLWQFYMVGGQLRASLELGNELLVIAEAAQSSNFLVLAHRAMATSLFLTGELERAAFHTEKGLGLYDSQKHGALAFRHGHDPAVAHCLYAAWALVLLGHLDRAVDRAEQAIVLAEKLAHPLSLAFALSYAAMIHQLRGEADGALDLAEQALPICTEHRFALWTAWATIQRGAGLAATGQVAEGLGILIKGSQGWLDTGARSGLTYFEALRAELLGQEGRHAEAMAAVDEVLATGERIDEHFNEAELFRLKGDLTLAIDPSARAEAEALYHRGLGIAAQKQARLHELRLWMSFGELLRATGRAEEAEQGLAAVLGWFKEGLGTPHLLRARSRLDAWRASR